MPRWWNDLFWLAAFLAGAVLLMILAKPLLGVPSRREGRWLGFVLACLLIAAGCANRPSAPPTARGGPCCVTPDGAGWDDTDQDDALQPT